MIKSLTFTGEYGYIVDKIPEPECPVRGYYGRDTISWKKLSKKDIEQIEKWEDECKEWEKHKDEYRNPNLVGFNNCFYDIENNEVVKLNPQVPIMPLKNTKVELYLKKHAKHLALSTKKLIFAFER